MSPQRQIITVDGVAASGKSALARLLAERLGYAHLNSGLLYRAAAFLALQEGISADDEKSVVEVLKRHSIALRYDRITGNQVVIDGGVRDGELVTQELSSLASAVAKHPGVREHFVDVQRSAFAPVGVVAEGRDMGTTIFPDAHPKFFVRADLGVRAERRRRQLAEKGEKIDAKAIERDLSRRDADDANRLISPMRPADGAIIIDNSSGTLEEIVEKMLRMVTDSGR